MSSCDAFAHSSGATAQAGVCQSLTACNADSTAESFSHLVTVALAEDLTLGTLVARCLPADCCLLCTPQSGLLLLLHPPWPKSWGKGADSAV